MIKKIMMLVSSAVLTGVVLTASATDVKAALPSTYDIINDANAQIADATANYEAAKADENAKLAVFNAVKADPAHSQLAYEVAAYDYNNAVNVSQWWLTKLNNAKAYLKNISDRGAFEDKFWDNRAAVIDLTKLRAAKTDADGAKNIANGTLAQIQNVEKAIAGFQEMVTYNKSLQPQLDALNLKLSILKEDYAKQSADASAKAALFDTYVNTLGYKNFSLGFDDYQYAREWERDNEKWDPSKYNY